MDGKAWGGLCPSLSDSATVAEFLSLSTCAISGSGFVRRRGFEHENCSCQSGFSFTDEDPGVHRGRVTCLRYTASR